MTSVQMPSNAGNAFVMVTVMPISGQIDEWLESNGKGIPPALQTALKNGMTVCQVPPVKSDTDTEVERKVNEEANPSGLGNTVWDVVRRLQGGLTEEDCQTAHKVFGIDTANQISLPIPKLPSLPSLSSLPLLSSLSGLSSYATRDHLIEAITLARDQLPTVVGVAACSAALMCRQPGLGLHYTAQRVESGLRPWLGTSLARLAAQPAAVLAAVGGIPLVLTAVPLYYGYLVVAEAGRQAVALGSDARQLSTIVQLIAARCEPIFRAADDLPADAIARVVALGLKQHLPDHVASVVQQAIYVGERTGNLSPRLVSVLEAAADWARGEQGRQLLDKLVQLTDPETDPTDAPQAA